MRLAIPAIGIAAFAYALVAFALAFRHVVSAAVCSISNLFPMVTR